MDFIQTSKKAGLAATVVLFCFILGTTETNKKELDALYQAHKWFQLRAAALKPNSPLFYKAAVESVFNKTSLAESDLKKVISSGPGSDEAYRARDLLTSLYLRAGRYRAAFDQNTEIVKNRPNQGDNSEIHTLLQVLSSSPDQSIIKRRASTVRARVINGNLLIPVQVESKHAEYIIDSAASFSTISESEARRLNLAVHSSGTMAGTVTGDRLGVKIAVAKRLSIGNIVIANPAFLVVPDEQPPFADLPAGDKGIIGLPVLLALQAIRWNQKTKNIDVAFSQDQVLQKANLCFEDLGLATQATVEGHSIGLVFDTGATSSQLWPLFARQFGDIVKGGTSDSVLMRGMAGSQRLPVRVIPELSISLGHKEIVLPQAVVFLQEGADLSQWYEGDLGMDVLAIHGFSIDFRTMSLRLN